jgi:hypothetical protein
LTVSTPAGTPPQLPTSPVSRAPQPAPTVSRVLPLPTSHAYSSSSSTTNTTDQNSLSSTTAAEYSRSWRHAKTRSEQRYDSAQLPRGVKKQRRTEEARTDAAAAMVLDLQARRARHLKNLRKEIRKLEELEQKILMSQLAPAPSSPAQEKVESLSHICDPVRNDRMVSASLVPPSSPARKLTFVKKTARVAARDPDGLWTAASPDKTDHGVESIRNTASSSGGPPVIHTGGDSSDVTSFTSVTRSSVASSFAVESSLSSNRSGDSSRRLSQRRAERRQGAASHSLQTETLQVSLDGFFVQTDTGWVHDIPFVNLEKNNCFGYLVTILPEASMQDVTVARPQSTMAPLFPLLNIMYCM